MRLNKPYDVIYMHANDDSLIQTKILFDCKYQMKFSVNGASLNVF